MNTNTKKPEVIRRLVKLGRDGTITEYHLINGTLQKVATRKADTR